MNRFLFGEDYDIYFAAETFTIMPIIAEPEKCDSLCRFDVDALPDAMIPIRKNAFQSYCHAEYYSEIVVE